MPPSLKCRRPPLTSRGRAAFLAFLLVRGAWAGPILPPDAAARAYEAGRDAIRRRDYAAAVEKLNEALATGHTTPQERLGTTRHFVLRYDPDYWLGVAHMERGEMDRARFHLTRSREHGVILRWPESSDLLARLARLEPKGLPSPEPAEPQTGASIAAPPATPPSREPPPSPTAAAIGVSAPAPDPQPTALQAGNGAGRLQEPSPPPSVAVDSAKLREAVTALSRGDLERASNLLAVLRSESPGAPELDLLSAVVYGTRYLLEGSRDAALAESARRAITAYRERGGSRSVERAWISPALAAILG